MWLFQDVSNNVWKKFYWGPFIKASRVPYIFALFLNVNKIYKESIKMQISHINFVYYIQQFLKAMWHGPFGGLWFKEVERKAH